jgi:molybdopterin-binding protein
MVPSGPFVAVTIDCGISITALVTISSAEDLDLVPGTKIWANFKSTAIHVIPEI